LGELITPKLNSLIRDLTTQLVNILRWHLKIYNLSPGMLIFYETFSEPLVIDDHSSQFFFPEASAEAGQ
jgi:hypothetical protein